MGAMASQITSLTFAYSIIYSGADQRTSKLHVTVLCVGNSPVTGEFPTQMASNAENVSIWWRHHDSFSDDLLLWFRGGDYLKSVKKCLHWDILLFQKYILYLLNHIYIYLLICSLAVESYINVYLYVA